ncbi:uncharacterized protein Dwil_GK18882 [Drosophila willistoni]|uniref:Uncharacterized protein n=1 Tax=Drosophila willistoni TaxID=7260 RepID=B4N5S3_DROWI|nr:uncharacterized protein Dwil_GK18882 [Drosophila willistoni]
MTEDSLRWDDQTNATSTELPNIDNRILIDTLPKCKTGYELRANRCRKSA